MKNQIFLVPIYVAVQAQSLEEACDTLTACLTENLMQEGIIKDWSYAKDTTNNLVQWMPVEQLGSGDDYSEDDFQRYVPKHFKTSK